ncbi:oligosaccharide repeat unit polymerase [Psychroflexus aestuariivivens]|uniref:oligosaccharide repeat unit polymerase n=1 Tax=Psychroflexus aestuariivivens TaxID=1795040 RepID=UPI000FDAD6F5|nr:oligosaccharide repeat unit polymerase [Psychroflexus aestuariivivens]
MILILVTLSLGLATILWRPYLSITVILLHAFVINWFAVKFFPISFGLYGSVGTLLLYFPIILLYFRGDKIIRKYFHIYLVFILLFFLWMYLISQYHGVSWMKYFMFFRNHFHYFLIFPLTIYTIQRKNYKWIIYPVIGILIIQIILFSIQMAIPSFQNYLIVEFRLTTDGLIRLVSEALLRGKTFVGTFLRPANIGNFLAIVIPSFYLLKILRILRIKRTFFYLIIIFLVSILLYTGIRTSFVTFIIISAGVLFILNKKTFTFFVVSATILLVVVLPTIKSLSSEYNREKSFENPLSRISFLFETTERETITEETTVSRTANMLEHYESFIWGNSHYTAGGFYKGISSITDATLAFNFIEYGIITFLLTLVLFIYPIKIIYTQSKRFFYLSLVFFIGVLFQTVTDQGLFTNYSSIPLFIILGLLYVYTIKQKNEI